MAQAAPIKGPGHIKWSIELGGLISAITLHEDALDNP